MRTEAEIRARLKAKEESVTRTWALVQGASPWAVIAGMVVQMPQISEVNELKWVLEEDEKK